LRKITIYAALLLLLANAFFIASAVEPGPLERLIETDDSRLQREVLHQIAKSKTNYSGELTQKLKSFYKRKGSYNELEKLFYVAALIKCKEAVPILEKIWLDQDNFIHVCF
jgi:hypothetical protein